MSRKLIITDPTHLAHLRQMFHEHKSDPDWSFQFVATQYAGNWRWGSTYWLVIRDAVTKQLWAARVNEQAGDEYYVSLDEDTTVTFFPVQPVMRIFYELEDETAPPPDGFARTVLDGWGTAEAAADCGATQDFRATQTDGIATLECTLMKGHCGDHWDGELDVCWPDKITESN